MEDYSGKSDRDLLIEVHTCVCNMECKIEKHDKEIEKLKSDNNKAKGGLYVISAGVGLIAAKLAGLF
jgi:hypothetical protein